MNEKTQQRPSKNQTSVTSNRCDAAHSEDLASEEIAGIAKRDEDGKSKVKKKTKKKPMFALGSWRGVFRGTRDF